MCTAISDNYSGHLFGRTLDLEYSYDERVTLTPRSFKLDFIYEGTELCHLAMLGTAHISRGVPLYYDAFNESGLAGAALRFGGCAVYGRRKNGAANVASFELIPFVLSRCRSIFEAKELLENVNITDDSFSRDLPTTPLHWIFADKNGALTVESVKSGLCVYENPFGVLTNSPEFEYHKIRVSEFMSLTAKDPENRLCRSIAQHPYSRGMGALGLPGDFSSASRFVRAFFAKSNTVSADKTSAVSRFFHIMDTVAEPAGCSLSEDGKPIMTVYTSCADTENGIYYFTTYGNRRIRAVNLHALDLDSDKIVSFLMSSDEDIERLN